MSSTRFRRCLSSVIITCVTVSVTPSGVSQVFAQGDENFAKGLLRGLTESQLDKHNRRDPFQPGPPAPGQPTQLVRQGLDEISDELTTLKQIIGVTIPWDRREMLQRASNLESIAENIRHTMEQWHRTAGIRDARRTTEGRQLISHCHELAERFTPELVRILTAVPE